MSSRYLWHPYTQHAWAEPPIPVRSASGAYLYTEDGGSLLDAISSWWVNLHGHGHPKIVQAIARQAAELDHVLFAGCTHAPARRLAERIIGFLERRGAPRRRAFFSDNGSTAVETALKMAYQFHLNHGRRGRSRFLALRNAFHGDTLGAMSICERQGFHSSFSSLMFETDFFALDALDGLKKLLKENRDRYAAFVFEPLVQGAAGMKMHSPGRLAQAVALCRENGILCVADEVFTGFGRTGEIFAHLKAGIEPDLICLSKGLTGGALPMGLTLANESVFEAFLAKDLKKALLHGHSYTANPIACAAASASWDLLMEEETLAAIRRISIQTEDWARRLRADRGFASVRSLGTIGAVELSGEAGYFSPGARGLMNRFRDQGVLLRPLGNVLYAVPPYCSTPAEIDRIYGLLAHVRDL